MQDNDMIDRENEVADYSPAATLVPFDQPLPLLRGPLPAGLSDDPSAGPYVLAFKDATSWRSAFRETESKIIQQCLAGARVACSISASKKCSPPWWKSVFGPAKVDFAERERCEEREMSACLDSAKEPCIGFAKGKCLAPFFEARIASIRAEEYAKAFSLPSDNSGSCLPQCNLEVTNYRGRALLEGEIKDCCNNKEL